MYGIKLPTIIVTTKDNNVFKCAIDYNVTFEDISKYLNEKFNGNLRNVTLGETILYLKKDIGK